MHIPLEIFPPHLIDQYDLVRKAKNGKIYLEIRRLIYGLPQSGKLANYFLKKKLAPTGYYEVPHTPGIWKHISRLVEFTLVVDAFGVKYVGEENIQHMIRSLKKDFTISEDWTGAYYCEITLKWAYAKRITDFSMPGYIKKILQRYTHEMPKRPQPSPYLVAQIKYDEAAHDPIPEDTSREASDKEILKEQHVLGSILYYARALDLTALMSLSIIASEQAKATGHTIQTMEQVLDYMASNPDAIMDF